MSINKFTFKHTDAFYLKKSIDLSNLNALIFFEMNHLDFYVSCLLIIYMRNNIICFYLHAC